MNREIKFRVWDNEEKKYFTPIYEAYKGNLLDLSITLSGEIMRRTLQTPAEHESCFKGRYEIQQFTGLKDKNGVDIYEGDILETRDNGVFLIANDYNDFIYTVIYSEDHSGLNGYTQKEIKVVGNIYENENLLKRIK